LEVVRETGDWEGWLLYVLRAIAETSIETLAIVENIRSLMAAFKKSLRDDHYKIYSQDLLNTLFRFPYTKIELVQKELGITRQTAAKYLPELCESKLISKHKFGMSNYSINDPLAALFLDAPSASEPDDVSEAGISAEVA
jgi:Fic family protein